MSEQCSEYCVGTGQTLSVFSWKAARDVEVFKEQNDSFQELGCLCSCRPIGDL